MLRPILSFAACALFATQALAADYLRPPAQVFAAPPQPAPVYAPPAQQAPSWNGCYVGANAGVNLVNATVQPQPQSDIGFPYYTSLEYAKHQINQVGPNLGGTFGCDVQLGAYVVGVALNGNYTPTKSTSYLGYSDPYSSIIRMTPDLSGIAALRLGRVFGDTFVYGKAGLGFGYFDYKTDYSAYTLRYGQCPATNFCSNSGNTVSYPDQVISLSASDAKKLQTGLALGLGAEHLLGDGWSLVGETNTIFFPTSTNNFTVDKETNFGTCNSCQTDGTGWHASPGDKWAYTMKAFTTTATIGVNKRF